MEFDKKKRADLLSVAVREIDYLFKNSSLKNLNPKFRAFIHEQKAEALELMGKYQKALIERNKSYILKNKK